MKRIAPFLLFLMSQLAFADPIKDMESALAAGDIQLAKSVVDSMYKDKSIITGPSAAYLSGYDQLVTIFRAVETFNGNYERFQNSKALEDYASLSYSQKSLVALTENMKEFAVSDETINLLNAKLSETDSEMDSARKLKSEIELAKAEAQKAEDQKQEREEQERIAAHAAEQERINKEMEAERVASEKAQAAFSAKLAARKKECGADFETPRIGMTLERAKHCVGSLKLKGQINRPDGVVSTYWAGNIYVHVMSGKIVSWGDLR